MNKLFKSWTNNTYLSEGLIEYVKNEISTKNASIDIGCDSSVNGSNVKYSVVVAIRYPIRGAHVLYRNILIDRIQIKSNWERLFKETEFSVEVANFLKDAGVIHFFTQLIGNQEKKDIHSRIKQSNRRTKTIIGFDDPFSVYVGGYDIGNSISQRLIH